MSEIALAHHGIKGQKWGIRRYQNKDGSLTAAGKKRAATLEKKYAKVTGKNIQTRSNSTSNHMSKEKMREETRNLQEKRAYLQAKKDVITLEKQVSKLESSDINKGKAFSKKYAKKAVQTLWKDIAWPMARDAMKNYAKDRIKNLKHSNTTVRGPSYSLLPELEK